MVHWGANAVLQLAFELGLFAAVVFALFGLDDLLLDVLHLAGVGRAEHRRVDERAPVPLCFAVFIPAWREGGVIGPMLRHLVAQWPQPSLRIYVGVYANDLATMLSVAQLAAHDARIQMVINRALGPTTKGDCLNRLWQRLRGDMEQGPWQAQAVLLHDAEDVVDSAELHALGAALHQVDFAQLPVLPLLAARRWIGPHYADEFAEAHGKELPVRAALGAPIPLAGVGCAFRVEWLARLGDGAGPFSADCLTEDYEIGLRLAALGAEGAFVRMHADDGRLIASRGMFPQDLAGAVMQKTRWLRGIALEAWGRVGWPVAPAASRWRRAASHWMVWRDRRAVVAAAAIFAGYGAMLLVLVARGLEGIAGGVPEQNAASSPAWTHSLGPGLPLLAGCNMLLLVWRQGMRVRFTVQRYGWQQGLWAILRQPVSNVILVMTARRALRDHWYGLRGKPLVWDKTEHIFPETTHALPIRAVDPAERDRM